MRPFLLGTPHPHARSAEGHATVEFLRRAGPAGEKSDRAFRFIYAVGEHTLAYHFSEPLVRIGVGTITRRTVEVALSLALTGLRGPLRRVLAGMDDAQLLLVADEIEVRLYPDPHGPGR
jgi:hypothetical protein